jgi:hypothetical protein
VADWVLIQRQIARAITAASGVTASHVLWTVSSCA